MPPYAAGVHLSSDLCSIYTVSSRTKYDRNPPPPPPGVVLFGGDMETDLLRKHFVH